MRDKITLQNGAILEPSWTDDVVLCYDYTGNTTLNPGASLAAGGTLIDGDAYYYKVIARMARLITVSGDATGQLSAWSLNAYDGFKCFWELTDDGGDRKVTLYKSATMDYVLATGTRNGDGAIDLVEKNGSGINGTVSVVYTADDSGSDNTIVYECNAVLGFDEVTETPAATDLSIDLAWDAPFGDLIEYRVYCGKTSGAYDFFYTSATNSLTDDGSLVKCYDEKYPKWRIINPSTLFIQSTYVNGVYKDAKSILQLGVDFGESHLIEYDLRDISNQPTWNLGTEAATTTARMEFVSWL